MIKVLCMFTVIFSLSPVRDAKTYEMFLDGQSRMSTQQQQPRQQQNQEVQLPRASGALNPIWPTRTSGIASSTFKTFIK